MQQIGEGQLDIPADWHNHSVNIFSLQSPGVAGLSITINRDQLPFQTTLGDYADEQTAKLKTQMKQFELISASSLELDRHAARRLEFTWQTDDAGPMHQILICVAQGHFLMNMAASFGGRMNEAQVKEVQRIFESFRFHAPKLNNPT
jgi:hypothetical protein